jgi:MFS family permease
VPEQRKQLLPFAALSASYFAHIGFFNPYLPLWLKDLGFGLFAISVLTSVQSATRLFAPYAWGTLSDRTGERVKLLRYGATAALIFSLALWFPLKIVAGMASGLRWVLAEAVVAEFAPPHQRGRMVGLFETMVGTTFVIGPALLALVGPTSPVALWIVLGFLVLGLLGSLWIPRLPAAADAHEARVGLHGVWHALRAHPLIMTVGFVGGFFESGLTSILPLYGLALGMGAAAAALLVSASGLGSALMMLPAGMAADRPSLQQRHGGEHGARVLILHACALITLLATVLIPFVAGAPWLAAAVAFVWGGAGGSLYTLAMIDIGSREEGITLVNSTAVLVLSYTLGGVLAPALGAAMLDWAPVIGFPALLLAVAGPGWWLLRREHRRLRSGRRGRA